MGIGEIEFLDDDEALDAPSGPGGLDVGERPAARGSASPAPPAYRYRPWPPTPTAALLAVVVTIVAALYLATTSGGAAGGRFDLAVVSAVYAAPPGQNGMVLALGVQNLGTSMVELTDWNVAQPGLIPAGVNGGFTHAAPVAVLPSEVASVLLTFNFDCRISALPRPATTTEVAGYDTRGVVRTATLPLPASTDPWQIGGQVRSAFCALPEPKDDLAVEYGGVADMLMAKTPVRFAYKLQLTAPPTRSILVGGVTQDNPGITASLDPPLPVTVLQGQTIRLTVTWRVTNCQLARDPTASDAVEIMASSPRGSEAWDAPLGVQFARDMTDEINTVC